MRLEWACESQKVKDSLGLAGDELRQEKLVAGVRGQIRKIRPEMNEKMFTAAEMGAIAKLNPDYVAHLIASPKDLERVLERYSVAKEAAREGVVAEVYSRPRVVKYAEGRA